jgi:glycosyltransferase involved in cell wall biosynthesis
VNVFYAITPDQWVEKLSILIKDASLREKMGREGRERVMKRYTVQACAPRLFSIFQRLVARGITE